MHFLKDKGENLLVNQPLLEGACLYLHKRKYRSCRKKRSCGVFMGHKNIIGG